MKKILFGLLYLGTTLMAEITNIPVSIEFIESNKMKIIDIRTQSEWKDLGVVKDAHFITFFNEKSKYDIDYFLEKLNKVIEKDEKFAIISNSSSRTKLISNLLGHKLDYDVVNLIGGMEKLIEEGYKVQEYAPEEKKQSVHEKEESVTSDEKNLLKKTTLLEKTVVPEKSLLALNDNNVTK